jgi:hypothetical protein
MSTWPEREHRLASDATFDWVLGRPLATVMGTLLVIHVVSWVPHYLTWPWWADHEVFGTMARGWDAGLRPYRDLVGNNFPGTIYLFWVIGHVFGWGKIAPFYALDAAMIVGLAVLIVAWSVRRFGRALPGLLGAGAMLSYFIDLDFSAAGQRDGQAPILAVAGLLVAQAWPGRASRLTSALVLALGASIRPQVVFFVPAYWMVIAEGARPADAPPSRALGPLLEWNLAVGALLALCFLPLALAGVMGDLIRGLRIVAYGGGYNSAGVSEFAYRFSLEVMDRRVLVVPLAVLLTRTMLGAEDRRLASAWIVAFLGVFFYAPLSPQMPPYSLHPLWLVWSIHVAILARIILTAPGMASIWRFVFLGVLISLSISLKPTNSSPSLSLRAIALLRKGESPVEEPRGYKHPHPAFIPVYPWADYRALLDYLRTSTPPQTRVANILKGVAVTAPIDRLPALPAESATWLMIVHGTDLPRFIEALERTPDSVVVWDQTYHAEWKVPEPLAAAVRRLYEPKAKFGDLEVWSRKPGT